MANEITKLKSSSMMYFQQDIANKLQAFNKSVTGLELTEKVLERLKSGAREAYVVLQAKGLSPSDLDVNNVVDVFQSVAFLPLNPNAYPKQSYFMTRSGGKGKPPILEYNVQGDGWETLFETYGKDLIRFRSVVIREGDFFSGIEYVGFEQKAPVIKLLNNDEIVEKGLHKKIRKVKQLIYMVRTEYGDEYHVINREDIKANILAQAKNNGAGVDLVREMSEVSVDEILDPKGKYLDMTIKNNWGNTVNILSPTYRDESAREGMIITKMKKFFCIKFPKDFDKDPENKNRGEILKRLYESRLEEDRYLVEEETVEEVMEGSKREFIEQANHDSLGEDLEVQVEDLDQEELEELEEVQEDEPVEELKELEEIKEEVKVEVKKETKVEPKKEEVKATQEKAKTDVPDWF